MFEEALFPSTDQNRFDSRTSNIFQTMDTVTSSRPFAVPQPDPDPNPDLKALFACVLIVYIAHVLLETTSIINKPADGSKNLETDIVLLEDVRGRTVSNDKDNSTAKELVFDSNRPEIELKTPFQSPAKYDPNNEKKRKKKKAKDKCAPLPAPKNNNPKDGDKDQQDGQGQGSGGSGSFQDTGSGGSGDSGSSGGNGNDGNGVAQDGQGSTTNHKAKSKAAKERNMIWFCSHCRWGPHSPELDDFCNSCFRQRDDNCLLEYFIRPRKAVAIDEEIGDMFRVMSLSDVDDDDDAGVLEKEKKLLAMGTVSCANESATNGFTPCRAKL